MNETRRPLIGRGSTRLVSLSVTCTDAADVHHK